MQAVILAAGRGLRLRPITETLPKALVDVCGVPLIVRILRALPSEVTETFVVVGHLKERVMDALGGTCEGMPIRYVVQDPLDGTGSALALLHDRLHGKFLVVNGDDLYAREDLERLVAHPLALLVSTVSAGIEAESSVLVDKDGRLVGIEASPPLQEQKLRVCGAYVLDERFFRYPLASVDVRGNTEFSLPHTLVKMSHDHTIKTEDATLWLPAGTPAELDRVRSVCGQLKNCC